MPSPQEFFKSYGLTQEKLALAQARRHRAASGSDEPRCGDRFQRGRRRAVGDPAAGYLWHRRAHGGDEHSRRKLTRNGNWKHEVPERCGSDSISVNQFPISFSISRCCCVERMKIHIKGGRLIDPANGIDATTISTSPRARSSPSARRRTASPPIAPWMRRGCVVAPGLIDLSARLREPGFEYKATLESEMAAAVAGGVTSLACPPDTDPPLDEPGLVEMLKFRARSLNQAKVFPLGALTMGLDGRAPHRDGGTAAMRVVSAFAQADVAVTDTLVLMRALQYAATFGFSVWLRPRGRQPCRGRRRPRRRGRDPPGAAADLPVRRDRGACRPFCCSRAETGVRVHLCRLSSARRRRDGAAGEGGPA